MRGPGRGGPTCTPQQRRDSLQCSCRTKGSGENCVQPLATKRDGLSLVVTENSYRESVDAVVSLHFATHLPCDGSILRLEPGRGVFWRSAVSRPGIGELWAELRHVVRSSRPRLWECGGCHGRMDWGSGIGDRSVGRWFLGVFLTSREFSRVTRHVDHHPDR